MIKIDDNVQISKLDWENSNYNDADIVFMGIPYDYTASQKKGTVNAPNFLRNHSDYLEEYSPMLKRDLSQIKLFDIGNVNIDNDDSSDLMVDNVYKFTKDIWNDDKKIVSVGGEHSVTFPIIKSAIEKYPDLHILHFDAHTDLRDEFQGDKNSHACVIRRIYDLVGDKKIFSFGIRSGSKEEFEYYDSKKIYVEQHTTKTLKTIVEKLKNKPVFITFDIDVFDPMYVSGTGTVEPGGIFWKDFEIIEKEILKLKKVIGLDVVEFTPNQDPTNVSLMTTLKVIRELILASFINKK